MAGNASSSTPDLQAILATLAQYAPPAEEITNGAEQYGGTDTSHLIDGALGSDTLVRDVAPAKEVLPKTQDPRLRPQGRSEISSPKPMIDPATITTWQDGLRCVTKIAAANAQFAVSIKRMMKDQRANEMRWYTEMQNLKQTLASRSSSAAKAQSILRSLNTNLSSEPPPAEDSEAGKEAELANFHRKVYSAQLSMEAAMTAELKGLGVPFFGTDEKLIVPEGSETSKEPVPEGQQRWSPFVTERQLLELRGKMIGHLEDLYRD